MECPNCGYELNEPIIKPGDKLYGYCAGFFGRDSYGVKEVVMVREREIVAIEDNRVVVAYFDGDRYPDGIEDDIVKSMIKEWKSEDNYHEGW